MKTPQRLFTAILLGALTGISVPSEAQNFSAEDLARRSIERRAVEAVIWGMPAVNFDLMYLSLIHI